MKTFKRKYICNKEKCILPCVVIISQYNDGRIIQPGICPLGNDNPDFRKASYNTLCETKNKEIKMDEIIKSLQWIKENQKYGVSGACDNLIEKCKKLTSNNSDYAVTEQSSSPKSCPVCCCEYIHYRLYDNKYCCENCNEEWA
jgi:hypothetical protein